jgi:hypothetical protein
LRRLCVSAVLASVIAACSTPTTPSEPAPAPAPPAPAAPVSDEPLHDTLNTAASAAGPNATSSELSGAYDQHVFDDFVSPRTATIRTVAWQGTRPTTRRPTKFFVAFVADAGGFPLRLQSDPVTGRVRALAWASYAIDDVNERLGTTQACGYTPPEQCGSYDYSVTLPAPFATVAGARYWLLIQAESPASVMSGWAWRRGQQDNTFSVSSIAGLTMPWDHAFALRP